jgi:hypothetical protein
MGKQTFGGAKNRRKSFVTRLANVDTGGGVVSVLNPEGVEILITEVVLVVETVATVACSVSVGVAANGTTLSGTLITALDVNAATGRFDNINDVGASGGRDRSCGATQYITASVSAGASAGLAGQLIVNYVV